MYRNPNGYGSVVKLAGKRRKPFAVRITADWTDEGKQVYKYLGYYSTRQEALISLAEYNTNPYDLKAQKVTFKEIYEYWSKRKYKTVSSQAVNSYTASFRNLASLHDMKMSEIRTRHLQGVFNDCTLGKSSQNNMKIVCAAIFEYAIKNDIIEKDYSAFIEIGQTPPKKVKKPFSKEEIDLLWHNLDKTPNIDLILILIYTGMRPSELLKIKTENIHLSEKYMTGGLKTKAGKNRAIPLNNKIVTFIENRYNKKNTNLVVFDDKNIEVKYAKFKRNFDEIMDMLKLEHSPHECRHTFASLMDSAGANKISIKKIMGHTTQDVTDGIYTHKTIEELLEAVNLI